MISFYRIMSIFIFLKSDAWSHIDNFSSMDDVYFDIDWPGPDDSYGLFEDLVMDESSFLMTSADQEKYYCVLPTNIKAGAQQDAETYVGPQEYELLTTLFEQTTCSYRIESYWTYELCHGKHLRQYHEDKELKQHKSKLQEYYLGVFDRLKGKQEYTRPRTVEGGQDSTSVPNMRLENVDYAYYQLNFTYGTECEVTGEQRKANIRYICHEDGHGEMYEIKETASCEYQVVVLTSLLCSHPSYQQKTQSVNRIECRSLEGAPAKPKASANFKEDYTRTTVYGTTGSNVDVVTRYTTAEKSSTSTESTSKTHTTVDPKDTSITHTQREPESAKGHAPSLPPSDQNLVREFLGGEYCITGGSGWWKHEFCFNKVVNQFHEERKKAKIEITLGRWHRDAHLKWLEKNPSKRPKDGKLRKSISHYYTQGDICDVTQQPRNVEVKLKCKENPDHPQAVSIYLVEPSTCEYILVVESPVMCPLIEAADRDGLMDEYVKKQLHVKAP